MYKAIPHIVYKLYLIYKKLFATIPAFEFSQEIHLPFENVGHTDIDIPCYLLNEGSVCTRK